MKEQEFEIEEGKIVEIKTLSMAPTDDKEVNDLLQEGWEMLDVRVIQGTQERSLQDGSPYVAMYPRIIWVLGRFEEGITLEDIPDL